MVCVILGFRFDGILPGIVLERIASNLGQWAGDQVKVEIAVFMSPAQSSVLTANFGLVLL